MNARSAIPRAAVLAEEAEEEGAEERARQSKLSGNRPL